MPDSMTTSTCTFTTFGIDRSYTNDDYGIGVYTASAGIKIEQPGLFSIPVGSFVSYDGEGRLCLGSGSDPVIGVVSSVDYRNDFSHPSTLIGVDLTQATPFYHFDGSDCCITITDDTDFSLEDGEFTIETWGTFPVVPPLGNAEFPFSIDWGWSPPEDIEDDIEEDEETSISELMMKDF